MADQDVSTNVALRNAFASVLATSDELRRLGVEHLETVDLEAIQPKVLAQATAAQALRGLVEELRRKAEKEEG